MKILALLCVAACGGDTVSSTETAQRAYLGLDKSVGKAITLGFDGFNSATSANITPQMVNGDVGGVLTVTGQVDQGMSANKGMRLNSQMVAYNDGTVMLDGKTVNITYSTDSDITAQPSLQMMLMGIPTGTISGTLQGTYHMTGDLKGDVTLDLMFNGMLMQGPAGSVVRVPGSTSITGTATSGSGTYDVTVML